MAGEWPTVAVREVTVRVTKGTTPTTIGGHFAAHGINFVKVESITESGRIERDKLAHIDEHSNALLSRSILEEDDILFTIAGTIGRVALVPASLLPANTNQAVAIVRPDKGKVLPRFLYYVLGDESRVRHAHSRVVQSVQANFSLAELSSLGIPLPDLGEQRAIAHILGTLDDKIELNRQMSETLEAMARALFKSWFVDFDPVRARAEGCDTGLPEHIADLFPDSFQDSELGDIPSGWQVTTVGDVCKRVAMGPFGSDIKTENFVVTGVPVVRGVNLRDGFLDDRFVFLTERKADELRNANAFPGDIVITHRGTLGQVGMIPLASQFPRYVVSQSQLLLSVAPERFSARYLFMFLRSPVGQHALLSNTSQTGVPAIARPTASMKSIPVTTPGRKVLEAFDRAVESLYQRRDLAVRDSLILARLRDSLLPRLISGEVGLQPSALQAWRGVDDCA